MIVAHVAICIYIVYIVTAIYEHYMYSHLCVSEGFMIVAHVADGYRASVWSGSDSRLCG